MERRTDMGKSKSNLWMRVCNYSAHMRRVSERRDEEEMPGLFNVGEAGKANEIAQRSGFHFAPGFP